MKNIRKIRILDLCLLLLVIDTHTKFEVTSYLSNSVARNDIARVYNVIVRCQ